MFLGSRIDDALTAYQPRIFEHGDRLAVDHVLDGRGAADRSNRGQENDSSDAVRASEQLGVQPCGDLVSRWLE
jgi:hypothetical protein